jgi:hypothetical protein
MANTYTLISSNTLSSSAASVTFSSIPATYTDLVLRVSARTTEANTDSSFNVTFNSDTATNYSRTRLVGNGATASSSRLSNSTSIDTSHNANGSTSTSNTFSNVEIYIPSYLVSQNKPVGLSNALENNTTTAYINASAGLWRNTAAITSIVLNGIPGAGSFASGSSFYLYGIKNS